MVTNSKNFNEENFKNQDEDFSKVNFNLDNFNNSVDTLTPKQRDMDIKNKNNDNPVAKDDKSISTLQDNNQQIDGRYQKDLNRDWSLSERILNRPAHKVVVAHRKELFNASAEYKIKFYKTVLDGRLEALSEKTNTGLMMIKAHYRQQVASFMMTKMYDLAKEVKVRQQEFLTMMMEKHDDVARLENYPALKTQYVNSILGEGERYMKFLDRLILRFENIIDEQLQNYR